ncbi:MAG: L,D-transpeptidase family protein [Candidatus Cyclobacteriaceae bacterium M2_1C_046]
MNKIYIYLLMAGILLSACSKKLKVAPVAGIKTYELGLKDSLYVVKLDNVNENYLGFTEKEITDIFKNYLDTVDLADYVMDPRIEDQLKQEIEIFYQENNYQIAWGKGKKPSRDANFITTRLSLASEEGLDPEDYKASELLDLLAETYSSKKYINIFELIELDLKLTGALLTYAWHMENGRIDPGATDWRWAFDIPQNPVAARLSKAVQNKKLKQELDGMKPDHQQYENLKKALTELRTMEHNGGWPILPGDLSLEEGDTSEFVLLLRERLIASEDHRNVWKKKLNDPVFDKKLKEALADFQRRHGLVDDGILGKSTLEMLNLPVEEKIRIVEVNLERLRWMPKEMPEDYLLVNLPDYTLKVIEKNKEAWNMRVITGKSPKHATPIFHDELEYLVLSPTWGVPSKIVRDEMMPKIKNDPDYLTRNGYQLYVQGDSSPVNPHSVDWSTGNVNVRVVQSPGPSNALGRVKFIMPNKYNIYLHDTPTDYLFKRNERDFSHGCIRLEKPKKLAEYLLRNDDNWDSERLEEHMYKSHSSTVWLNEPVPVYIMYQTAFTDSDGQINFRKDIYDHDKKQADLITGGLN